MQTRPEETQEVLAMIVSGKSLERIVSGHAMLVVTNVKNKRNIRKTPDGADDKSQLGACARCRDLKV